MKKRKRSNDQKITAILQRMMVGVLSGSILMCLFLVILSVGFVKSGNLPDGILPVVLQICAIISALLAGFVCGKLHKKNGLLLGLCCGALYVLILVVVKLFLQVNDYSTVSLIRYVTVILGSMIGGIIGVNRTQKSSKKIKQGRRNV